MNPSCAYGKIALANKALDEVHDQQIRQMVLDRGSARPRN